MDDLNDVLCFVRVAERLSFTEAARNLGIAKSLASRRVARLESALKVPLLQRSRRVVRLTDAGRQYFERCREMILGIEAATAQVENLHSEPTGTIRLSAPVILGQAFLPAIVCLFLAEHPLARCVVELSNRKVDLVEEGFDLALRVGPLADSALRQRKIGSVGTALYASIDYLTSRGVPERPEALAAHDLLHLAATDRDARWVLANGRDTAVIDLRPRLAATDPGILREAARKGLGIASLPVFAAHRDCAEGRLSPVLPGWHSPRLPVHLLFPPHKAMSPTVRALVETIAASFPNFCT